MIPHAPRYAEPRRRWPSRVIGSVMGREPQRDGPTLMDAAERDLKAAVERRHGLTARLAYIDAVSIVIAGRLAWNGTVLVFDLDSQPEAERVYAWFTPGQETVGRQAHVVRHGPGVHSAHDAVTAALAGPSRLPGFTPAPAGSGTAAGGASAIRHPRS